MGATMQPNADTVILAEIGGRLRAIRKAYHLTQADVASALGVDQSLWSKWERGQRAPDLLRLMEFAHRANTSIELICFGVLFRTAPELAEALAELAREDHTIVFRSETHNFVVDASLRLGAGKKSPSSRRTG